MATARAIIQDALTEIGAYAAGETMSSADASLGLLRLTNQIDSWKADRLTLAVQTRVTYTIPAGINTVTIGPTGTIVTQRPVWISGINYINPGTNPEVETMLGPMDDDSYRVLTIKQQTSTLPQQFYYNPNDTNGTLFFWPTVTQNVGIALYLPQGVTDPTTLDSILIGPPGYQEAFMYQLALRLMQPFARKATDCPNLSIMAANAFEAMKKPNVQPGLLGIDAALVPAFGAGYNVLSDTSTSSSNR